MSTPLHMLPTRTTTFGESLAVHDVIPRAARAIVLADRAAGLRPRKLLLPGQVYAHEVTEETWVLPILSRWVCIAGTGRPGSVPGQDHGHPSAVEHALLKIDAQADANAVEDPVFARGLAAAAAIIRDELLPR